MKRAVHALLLLGVIQILYFRPCIAMQVDDGSAASDSVFAWLVNSGNVLSEALEEAAVYEDAGLAVYIDSVESLGTKTYRVLLGIYDTREAAMRDNILVPMTVRQEARIIVLARPPTSYTEELKAATVSPAPDEPSGPDRPQPQATLVASGQPDSRREVYVFLDCPACDQDFVKREVDFVNYVVDRQDANVHILITVQNSGGGTKYVLNFIGLKRFVGLDDQLEYSSSDTDTSAERREGLTNIIRLGLARYVARTGLAGNLLVKLSGKGSRSPVSQAGDSWKAWRFKISLDGSYTSEESITSYQLGGNLRADRVTDEWKIRLSTNGNYKESRFEVDDGTIVSTKRNGNVNLLVVNSLARKWSLGVFGTASTSSFKNTDLAGTFAPALEYTVFPYSESSNRELRLSYFLNLHHFDYDEQTIFDKTSEEVLQHELQASLEFRQPWGTALGSLTASNYLTDFEESLRDLYSIEIYGYFEVRLVRGLSLWVEGSASRIRDQIYLSKKKASPEDILLGTVSLPTDYQYDVSAGLVFTFGSIFNSTVNSRFGS